MAAKKKTTPPKQRTDAEIKAGHNSLAQYEAPPKADLIVGRAEGNEIALHRLEGVMKALERLIPNVLKLEAAAERAKILDEDTFNKGSTFCSTVDREWDQIEALRKSVYKPVWDYGKLIQATFTPYLTRLENARTKVKGLMTTFYRQEEARKKAEQDKIRQQQEEEARKIAAAEATKGNEDVADAILQAALSAPAPTTAVTLGQERNALGEKVSVRKSWKATIINRNALLQAIIDGKVPAIVIEFKQSELNTVARQVAAEGEIHGLKITHEADLNMRS